MTRSRKVLQKVLSGEADAGIRFTDLRTLLLRVGFDERVRGSHHIFVRDGVQEILNLQRDSNKAKPYQVKQVRSLLIRYGIRLEER